MQGSIDRLVQLFKSEKNNRYTINTLDGSTLGDNLILSYQVDYVSSVLIPAEVVENIYKYFVAKGR